MQPQPPVAPAAGQTTGAALELRPWVWAVFLLLLALAPGSTKVAGSAWLLTVLLGAWAWFKHRSWRPGSEAEQALWRAARLWLAFCVLAFAFKAIGVIYWGDPWRTRHFDFRVLLSALALFFLMVRVQVTQVRRQQIVGALLLAACTGFLVSYLHATHDLETPSNRINWAGGLVMLSWVLLPVVASTSFARAWRWAALVGALLLWTAVLMSGARSAYLSMPWLLVCAFVLLARYRGHRLWGRWMVAGVLSVMLSLAGLDMLVPKVLEVPRYRVELAIEEAQLALLGDRDRNVDTPVGSRLYMWQRSLEVFKESPWIGHGRAQRIAFIKAWGKQAGAHIVSDQSHLHSEYINGMVDHGLVGLASTLSYMLGLVVVALSLRRAHTLMALSVGAIAFTHVTMSLTNANSQTNNYSVIFGLSMTLVFLLRLDRQPELPARSP